VEDVADNWQRHELKWGKNYMPVVHGDEVYFVTSPMPLLMMKCEGESAAACQFLNLGDARASNYIIREINLPKLRTSYKTTMAIRGGGNGIVYKDRFLYVRERNARAKRATSH